MSKIKWIGLALGLVIAAGILYWINGQLGWTAIGLLSEMEEGVPNLHEVDQVFLYLVLLENGPIALKTDPPHPQACEIRWNDARSRFEESCLGSIYELDGSYRFGPSLRGMDHYAVRIKDGVLQVKLSSVTMGEVHE